jgi:effector-binding domain-containing protein
MDLELGAPVAAGVTGAGRVAPGELPAGRWATLLHAGPFSGLQASHEELQSWVRSERMAVDLRDGVWAGCVERYLTDPREEPDSSRWETEIAYLLG